MGGAIYGILWAYGRENSATLGISGGYVAGHGCPINPVVCRCAFCAAFPPHHPPPPLPPPVPAPDAERVDGVAIEVQFPNDQAEELGYLNMTARDDYPDLESARQRFVDLLHYQKNRVSYRKRTEIAVEIVRQRRLKAIFQRRLMPLTTAYCRYRWPS